MKKTFILSFFVLFFISSTRLSAQLINYNGKGYYLNGVNIPWNLYSQDFGTHYLWGAQYDSAWFENAFAQCEIYGINCTRFWLHTDGATSPEFDANGFVTGLDTNFFSNLDDLFMRAQRHHIMVIPSIWDFSMMNNDSALGKYAGMHANLIQDTNRTRSYINNALIPMVQRYANQCNLLAWEIINEPEWGMNVAYAGTTTQNVNANEMQRFVGMCAEAIHQYSTKMVTVGSASLRYNSDKFDITTPCVANYWKDQAIKNAYNKPLAFLDFYEVHYYDWMNGIISFDPYKSGCQVSYWLLDKPTLIGESQGNSTKHSPNNMLYNAFTGNYAGVLFWSFSAGADSMGQFHQFNSDLLAFRNAAASVIDFDTTACNSTTGIDQPFKENPISISPNPAANIVNIKGVTGKTKIKLYDAIGKLVMEGEAESDFSLNISCLKQGVYTIITDDCKATGFNKVVVVK